MNFPEPIGDEHLRAMGLGISGPHGCGKTTLAEYIVKKNKCPFVASSGTPVAKEMGIKVELGMPIELRMDYQERVLDQAISLYDKQNGLFVTDRTPLDFAAYASLDSLGGNVSLGMQERILTYIKRCLVTCNRYFFHLITVQPGIPYVEDGRRPVYNVLNQELMNSAIIGLAMSQEIKCFATFIPREVTDLEVRASMATSNYSENLTNYSRHLKSRLTLQ